MAKKIKKETKKVKTKKGVNPYTGAILTVPVKSSLGKQFEKLDKEIGTAMAKAMTIDPRVCSFCGGPRIEITRRGILMWRCLDCGIEVSK